MSPETRKNEKRISVVKGLVFVISAALLLILLVWLLPVHMQRFIAGNKKPQAEIMTPIFPVAPTDILGFGVKSVGDEVSLTRTAQGWMLTQPTDTRANPIAVAAFLNALSSWTPERRLSAALQPGQEAFPPENTLNYTVTGPDQKPILIQVCKFTAEPQLLLLRQEGIPGLWLIKKAPELELAGLAERLRDHRIFDDSFSDIVRLSFRDLESVITLEKNLPHIKTRLTSTFGAKQQVTVTAEALEADNSWAVVYPHPGPASQKVVDSILETIENWEADKFVEESVGEKSTLAKYGLIKPTQEITAFTGAQRYPVMISFGAVPENEGRVYMKTSLSPRIIECREEKLIILQELFSHVVSHTIVPFIDQVARIEITTPNWRVTIARQADLWEAAWQKNTASLKDVRPQAERLPEDEVMFFEGEIIVQAIRDAEYLDLLTENNPFYRQFRNAEMVMKIFFLKENGLISDVFTIQKNRHMNEVVFVKRQTDDQTYVVVGSLYTDIIKETEYQKSHQGKKHAP